MTVAATANPPIGAYRPTVDLPIGALIRISLFWLGLTSIDAVVTSAVASRIKFEHLAAPGTEGTALATVAILTFIFSVAVQPTVGSISDYAQTRWGRRKPFIVFGALFDALFLIGIATANSLMAIAAFVVLLSFSTNIARGPFQGYVPDLVPDKQVGLASSMVGLMQVLGNVVGFALAAIANVEGSVGLAIVAVAAIELVTMISVVVRVPNGPPAKPREGKSWLSIAAETWGTDILRERSYVWLLASRLFILMGGAALLNFIYLYLPDSLGLTQSESGSAFLMMLLAATAVSLLAIVPASRLSDRIGRKPVIYGCTVLGAIGLGIIAVAPSVTVAAVGAALFGASQGTFLAVDWALMTDIIPRASSGRYMGLSNVVTASATTIAVAIGGIFIDNVNRSVGLGSGPRLELVLGVVYFALGALALRPVVEPRRRGLDAPPASPSAPAATADA
jgi:MFS family permease